MYVSFEASKACAMIILMGIIFLIAFHILRRRIDDVGIGVLFGLYDFRFEILALFSTSSISNMPMVSVLTRSACLDWNLLQDLM